MTTSLYKSKQTTLGKGDKISLQLPMDVSVVESHEIKLNHIKTGKEKYWAPGEARIDSTVDVNRNGSPFAYVMRGPLLYALKGDVISANQIKDANWDYNYTLVAKTKEFEVKNGSINNNWVWDVNTPPVSIEIDAQKYDWYLTKTNPQMPKEFVKQDKNKLTKITLVPFGCTRYRVSAFPLVK